MKAKIHFLIVLFIFLALVSFYGNLYVSEAQDNLGVYFSPKNGVRQAVIEKLDAARTEIDVAMYIFSNQELADALISAHRRGVNVRVLLDGSEDEHAYSKGRYLFDHGVKIRVDRSHILFPGESQGIMHNKFAIIDNTTVITGSYNWTDAAEIHNDENVLIINDAGDVSRRYKAQYEKLWERSVPYDVKELPAPLVISATDIKALRKNADKKAYVQGFVHNVYFSERSGTYFINFGPGRSSFTGVIFKSAAEKFTEKRVDPMEYEEKEIELFGKIIDHPKYGLEIIIEDPVQIRELSTKE